MPVVLNVSYVSLADHDAPHLRVRSIHGRVGECEWAHTQEQAIEFIQSGLFSYHLLRDARAVRLVVDRAASGEKFLKAEPDGEIPGLLLQLASTMASKTQPPSA